MISLVVIYFVLTTIVIPKVSNTLAERRATIDGDLDLAAEYASKAKAAEDSYKAALEAARAEARAIAEKTETEIKAQLDAALAEADVKIAEKTAETERELAAIRAEAGANAESVANAVAAALLEKFSPKSVDSGAVGAAVKANLTGKFGA